MKLAQSTARRMLVRAPFSVALGFSFCLSSCLSDGPIELDPATIAGNQSTKIDIVPLNLVIPLPDQMKSSIAIVSSALVDRLEANHKKVRAVDPRTAGRLWVASTRAVKEAGEELTFENAAGRFARQLAEQSDFDALLISSVFVQNARILDKVARWDSATQRVEFKGQSRWEVEMPELTTLEAASILIYILDPAGNILHFRRTGLELIQHLSIESSDRRGHDKRIWSPTAEEPALEDPIRVRAAIAHALHPFLPK